MIPPAFNDIRFFQISENAISIEFGGDICEETLEKIIRLNLVIKATPFAGLLSTIPAHNTLTLYFNWIGLMNDRSLQGETAFDKIAGFVKGIHLDAIAEQLTQRPIIHIPVCYEEEFGWDLQELTDLYQLKKEEIIELHSSAVYTVFMIGFVPGFPYLGGLSAKLKDHSPPF